MAVSHFIADTKNGIFNYRYNLCQPLNNPLVFKIKSQLNDLELNVDLALSSWRLVPNALLVRERTISCFLSLNSTSLSGCLWHVTRSSYFVFFFRHILIFACLNSATSFISGFVIFSVLGFMANKQGLSVDKVAGSGKDKTFTLLTRSQAQKRTAHLLPFLFGENSRYQY